MVNQELLSVARVHMVNLNRLFSHLETAYTPILDKNPDLRQHYVEVSDNLARFEVLGIDEQLITTMESIELVRRIEFLFETFSADTPEQLVH